MSAKVECVKSTDPFLQSRILPNWEQDYTQLSGGLFVGGVARTSIENIQVFREWINQAVDQRAVADDNVLMIGITLHKTRSSWQHREMEPDSLFILRAGEEARFRTSAQSDIIAATIDSDYLESLCQGLYAVSTSTLTYGASILTGDPKYISRFRSLLLSTLCSTLKNPLTIDVEYSRKNLAEEVTIAALQAMGSITSANRNVSQNHRIHRAIVDRTRSFIHDHPDHNPTVAELCEYLGMGPRGLHNAFMQVLGVNPSTYIRQVRLHAAHKEILQGVDSITDIAIRWGFWHLGMFSKYYKQQFGEAPSVTCRNPPQLFSESWLRS